MGQAYGNYITGHFQWGPEVYEPGWSVFNNDFVVDDTCTGDACVGLYTDNGVNTSNTTIYGNVTDPSRPIPPRPSN